MTVLTESDKSVMVGFSKGRMYEVEVLETIVVNAQSARSHEKPGDILTWHRRLGHIAIPRILRMAKRNLVDGLKMTSREVYHWDV